LLGKEQVKHF